VSEVWERRGSESSRAFHAFTHYRDVEPRQRSIAAAFAAHRSSCSGQHQASTIPVPSQWKKWSSEHEWVVRAAAYDSHRDSLLREARERALVDSPGRWAELARELQSRAFQSLSERDLSLETVRELRLLITDGIRLEREAYEFETRRGLGDVDAGIQRFLDAVAPSAEQVAALYDAREGEETSDTPLFDVLGDDDF